MQDQLDKLEEEIENSYKQKTKPQGSTRKVMSVTARESARQVQSAAQPPPVAHVSMADPVQYTAPQGIYSQNPYYGNQPVDYGYDYQSGYPYAAGPPKYYDEETEKSRDRRKKRRDDSEESASRRKPKKKHKKREPSESESALRSPRGNSRQPGVQTAPLAGQPANPMAGMMQGMQGMDPMMQNLMLMQMMASMNNSKKKKDKKKKKRRRRDSSSVAFDQQESAAPMNVYYHPQGAPIPATIQPQSSITRRAGNLAVGGFSNTANLPAKKPTFSDTQSLSISRAK